MGWEWAEMSFTDLDALMETISFCLMRWTTAMTPFALARDAVEACQTHVAVLHWKGSFGVAAKLNLAITWIKVLRHQETGIIHSLTHIYYINILYLINT